MLFVVPRVGNLLIGFFANRSFFAKKERMSNSFKKMSDLLIFSFLVSDLLTVAHFW